MHFKIATLISTFIFSTIPLFAYADIIVTDNTNSPATGLVDGACTSIAGRQGIVQPHGSLTISQSTLNKYCKSCTLDVYMTKDCLFSGHGKIAIAYINKNEGITNIVMEKGSNYKINWTKNSAVIEDGSKESIFKKLFG